MPVQATKFITFNYPRGHEKAGSGILKFMPGTRIPDDVAELLSEKIQLNCTSIGVDTSSYDQEEVPDELAEEGDGLEVLTVANLREIVANEGVVVEGGNRKQNLIESIRAKREEA